MFRKIQILADSFVFECLNNKYSKLYLELVLNLKELCKGMSIFRADYYQVERISDKTQLPNLFF